MRSSTYALTLILTFALGLMALATGPKQDPALVELRMHQLAQRAVEAQTAVGQVVAEIHAGEQPDGLEAWRAIARVELALVELLDAGKVQTPEPEPQPQPAPRPDPDPIPEPEPGGNGPPAGSDPGGLEGPTDGAARARAKEIAEEARRALASAFADLAPEERREEIEELLLAALRGEDVDVTPLWNGATARLAWTGASWTLNGSHEGKPLAAAVEAAGPWGRVVLETPDAPPVSHGGIGLHSWQGININHPGPVLVQGMRIQGVALGGTAPGLWFEDLSTSMADGASSMVGVAAGSVGAHPVVFRRVNFGVAMPESKRFEGFPAKWGIRAHGQVGGIGVLQSTFAAGSMEEHPIYISNSQRALLVQDCVLPATVRTGAQIVNRTGDGPPATGPMAFVRLRAAVSTRKQMGEAGSPGKGHGGGSTITIAGHGGPVALLDLALEALQDPGYPWTLHNGLIGIWCEPFSNQSMPHLAPGGWWTDELAIAGLRITGPELRTDRPGILLSGVRRALVEAPAPWAPTMPNNTGRLIVLNDNGPNHHGPGGEPRNPELGQLIWERVDDDAPWWVVHGKHWASSLPAHPPSGTYKPQD